MCAFFSRVAVSVEIQAIADTRAAGGRKDRAWYPDFKPASLPGFQIGGDTR
jgi:hypothetical protein